MRKRNILDIKDLVYPMYCVDKAWDLLMEAMNGRFVITPAFASRAYA